MPNALPSFFGLNYQGASSSDLIAIVFRGCCKFNRNGMIIMLNLPGFHQKCFQGYQDSAQLKGLHVHIQYYVLEEQTVDQKGRIEIVKIGTAKCTLIVLIGHHRILFVIFTPFILLLLSNKLNLTKGIDLVGKKSLICNATQLTRLSLEL